MSIDASGFGGRDTLDYSGAHQNWIQGLEAYQAEQLALSGGSWTEAKSTATHRVQVARRLVDWVAHMYPGLHPDDFTWEMGSEHRRYVHQACKKGSSLRTFHGARGLIELLERAELRTPAERNPFESRVNKGVPEPQGLPRELAEWRRRLNLWAAEQGDLRIATDGADGYSYDYLGGITRNLDGWLLYIQKHNAQVQDPSELWSLDLDQLLTDVTPAAEFLRAAPVYGHTRHATPVEKSRERRMYDLFRFYEWVRDESDGSVGTKDWRARLTERLKGKGHRKKTKKIHLGGVESKVIVALTHAELDAVEARLDKRKARAAAAMTRAKGQADMQRARKQMFYALRLRALWEVGLWSALRAEALSSIDLSKIHELPGGSWMCDEVRMKTKEAGLWRAHWIAPRAIRALEEMLVFMGRSLV